MGVRNYIVSDFCGMPAALSPLGHVLHANLRNDDGLVYTHRIVQQSAIKNQLDQPTEEW